MWTARGTACRARACGSCCAPQPAGLPAERAACLACKLAPTRGRRAGRRSNACGACQTWCCYTPRAGLPSPVGGPCPLASPAGARARERGEHRLLHRGPAGEGAGGGTAGRGHCHHLWQGGCNAGRGAAARSKGGAPGHGTTPCQHCRAQKRHKQHEPVPLSPGAQETHTQAASTDPQGS